jgi:hypothetical protein
MFDYRVKPMNPAETSVTKEGMIVLGKHHAWNHLAKYSANLLVGNKDALSVSDYITLIMLRFEALFRLKFYDDLNNEITSSLSTFFSMIKQSKGIALSSTFDNLLDLDPHSVDFVCSLRLLHYEVHLLSGPSCCPIFSYHLFSFVLL